MKKYSLVIVLSTFYSLFAQKSHEYSTIKLYIDKYQITKDNSKNLTENEINRLYQRTSQLVNQAGITEIGYSNFLVSPILDVISIDEDNAGTTKTFQVECELFITIKRTNIEKEDLLGSASFATFSKKIMGAGFTKEEARSNALSNIRASDEDYRDFFLDSKKKIDEYYKVHCDDILDEAAQALTLKDYPKSISLYFSVPTNATCYTKAYNEAVKVYTTYVEDKCQKQVALMKTYAVLAQNEKSDAKKCYDSIVNLIKEISPSSDKCYAAAKKIVEDIEKNLNEKQKHDWELEKIYSADEKEIEKERYKAMQNINQNYVPSSTIIIK